MMPFLLILLTALPTASVPAGRVERTYDVPNHGVLRLTIPAGIRDVQEYSPVDGSLGILLQSEDPIGFHCLISVATVETFPEKEELSNFLRQKLLAAAKPYLAQVHQPSPDIVSLSGSRSLGLAYSLVDPELENKPPVPEKYPYFRQGVILTGELLLSYSVFMHSRPNEFVPLVEGILLEAEQERPEPVKK